MHRRPRHPESGVTLVEMLVVLSIIGVAAGAILLRSPGNGSGQAKTEALRLAALLSQASDTALITGQVQALVWSADGYYLLSARPDGGWSQPLAATSRSFAGPLRLSRRDGLSAPLIIAASGLAGPASLTLTTGPGSGPDSGPDSGPNTRTDTRTDTWRVDFDGLVAAARPEPAP